MGQDMLPGVLLHVVQTAIPIDSAVNTLCGNASFDNMDYLAGFFFLKTIDEVCINESSEIIRLAARGRIKSGLIENDTDFVTDRSCFDYIRIELQKIRVVVIKTFRFHTRF